MTNKLWQKRAYALASAVQVACEFFYGPFCLGEPTLFGLKGEPKGNAPPAICVSVPFLLLFFFFWGGGAGYHLAVGQKTGT